MKIHAIRFQERIQRVLYAKTGTCGNHSSVYELHSCQRDRQYKEAVGLLYAVAYTLKMSEKSGYEMKGFFDYVVPPLEGLWWQQGSDEKIDYSRKDDFSWISMIRIPDFVSPSDD